MIKRLLPLFLLLLLVVSSCKKNNEDDPDNVDNFDRSGLVQNQANNVIVPAYLEWKLSADSLVNATVSFNSSLNLSSLQSLRETLFYSWKKWVRCSMYEFGPAASISLRQTVNVFPTDSVQIAANISSGTYDFLAVSNIDAIGYPAIEFLLYQPGKTDADIVSDFINSAARRNYISDLAVDLQSKANQVYSAWNPASGNYAATFTASTRLDVGSSIGNLVNQLNFDYEILKNARVGIPAGKQTLNVAMPNQCEAYYSGRSIEIIQEHLNGLENAFLGRSPAGVNGKGLDDYLEYLNAQSTSGPLASSITNKFAEIRASFAELSGPLSSSVINEVPGVDDAYTKILQGLVMLKSEMPSALGVLITYQDNDGD